MCARDHCNAVVAWPSLAAVQFSELASLFGNFQVIRLIHFLCMSAIVAFVAVHVMLALLVPQSLIAMLTGGPIVADTLAAEVGATPAAKPAAKIEATPLRR
jgi:hypothetical protein